MITLSGEVIGARVRFFSLIRPREKNILCLGLYHIMYRNYLTLNRGGGGANYVPKWLEKLAQSSTGDTLILLEIPPLTPETIELDEIDQTIPFVVDAIIAHSIKRLRPYFKKDGVARKKRWILDGCDLRYRYQVEEGRLVRNEMGYRSQTLHKDLPDGLPNWKPQGPALTNYYNYLTGLSDNKGAYDHFVNEVITAGRNTHKNAKKAIFAQAASRCRPVYKLIPDELKRSIISTLGWKLYDAANKAEAGLRDPELRGATESVAQAVIQYGVGEQLMNLYLLGNILQPDDDFRNVVIVAGDAHIDVIIDFLKSPPPVARRFLGLGEIVSGTCGRKENVGYCTKLTKPITLR